MPLRSSHGPRVFRHAKWKPLYYLAFAKNADLSRKSPAPVYRLYICIYLFSLGSPDRFRIYKFERVAVAVCSFRSHPSNRADPPAGGKSRADINCLSLADESRNYLHNQYSAPFFFFHARWQSDPARILIYSDEKKRIANYSRSTDPIDSADKFAEHGGAIIKTRCPPLECDISAARPAIAPRAISIFALLPFGIALESSSASVLNYWVIFTDRQRVSIGSRGRYSGNTLLW